jgi:hypothetical protein
MNYLAASSIMEHRYAPGNIIVAEATILERLSEPQHHRAAPLRVSAARPASVDPKKMTRVYFCGISLIRIDALPSIHVLRI